MRGISIPMMPSSTAAGMYSRYGAIWSYHRRKSVKIDRTPGRPSARGPLPELLRMTVYSRRLAFEFWVNRMGRKGRTQGEDNVGGRLAALLSHQSACC